MTSCLWTWCLACTLFFSFAAQSFQKPLAIARKQLPPGARDAPNQQSSVELQEYIPKQLTGGVPAGYEMVDSDQKSELYAPAPRTGASRALSSAISHSSVVKTRLVDIAGLTTSAGGTVYFADAIYTRMIALGEEDDFQALFREFRITNVRVHYIPYTPFKVEAATNTNGRPMVMAFDPYDASVPSSSALVWANASAIVFHTQREATIRWRNDDKRWFSTSTTTNPLQPALSLKGAVDANAGTSIPVGALYYEFFVEYRSRL